MKKLLVTWILIAAMALSPAMAFAEESNGFSDSAAESEAVEMMEDPAGETGTSEEEAASNENSPEQAEGAALEEGTSEKQSIETENPALGAESNATIDVDVTFEDGSSRKFTSASTLVDTLYSYGNKTFTIKLNSDVTTGSAGRILAPEGSHVTLDLNGHVLNRGKTTKSYSYDDNWEVIIVAKNANLTIIDSFPKMVNGGYLGGDDGKYQLWFYDQMNHNKAILGGVITGGASGNSGHGGGITIEQGATVTMKGGTIAGNMSEEGGGGVNLSGSKSKFILDGGNILYNGAYKQNGGGIKAENGTVELISGNISHNWTKEGITIGGRGGGIFMDYETDRALYIHGSITDEEGNKRSVNISNNYAENEGGGVFLDEGTSVLLNVAVENNKCDDGDGGGIYVNDDGDSGSPTAITGCVVTGNTASGDGGGIIVSDQGNINIANCTVTNNTAGDEGGGIYYNAYGDACTLRDCTITGNKAKRNGGGVHQYDTVALGGKMIVKDNSTTDDKLDNYYIYVYTVGALMTIDDLSRESELYVSNNWGGVGDVINDAPTKGSARGIYSDQGEYHFEKINDPTNKNYRKIVQKAGKAPDIPTEWFDAWKNVSRDTSRTASNLGYTMKVDTSKDPVNGAPVYLGYYRFSDVLDGKEGEYHSANFYYTDGVFFNDPEKYDTHLASMSASLALASGASTKGVSTVLIPETQKNRFNYITQAFSDIGCTNESMYVNDCFMRKPETDTMGAVMANKTIYKDNVESEENAYLLIPIFVRGINYGPEWVSNATLGDGSVNGGEAEGFSTAADLVENDIDTYIQNHPEVKAAIENGRAKFWLGGYSRGGAVANLVSKRLTDRFTGGGAGSSTGNEVFAYCMASPNAGVENLDKEGGYLNIHNVISKSDLVTYVAPSAMGFKRYGVDHYLPGGEAGEVKATIKTYGPDDKLLTTYSDNTNYPVDFSNTDYLNFRKKLLSQLIATTPDLEFNDYFHAAEVNYLWGNEYTKWVPILGKNMIEEADYEPLSTKAKFCEQFWERLMKYSVNTANSGADWKKDGKSSSGKDAKDYRKFYATERSYQFMGGSKFIDGNAATLEEALSTMVYLLMSGEKDLDTTDLVDLTGAASDIALDAYDELIGDLYDNSSARYDAWFDKIWEIMSTDLTDEQKAKGYKNLRDILGDDIEKVEAVFPTLIAIALDLVNDDYNDTDKGQYLLGTMAYNASDLTTDHVIMCQWLRAEDDWYANDGDKYYNINIGSNYPWVPEAWLSPAVKGGPEMQLARTETNTAQTNQKLYLRTQPGGAVYYTLKVEGETKVDDQLYQGASGIELPAGKAVTVTVYSKAYEQTSAVGTYTIEVKNSEEQDAADQMLDDADNAIDEAQAADTTAQDEAYKAEESAASAKPDEAIISGADAAADIALQAAKTAEEDAEKALEAAKSAYGEDSEQAEEAANALAAAKRLVASAAAAKASTAQSAATAAAKRAATAKAAADKAAKTPGKKAVNAAIAAKTAADEAVAKAQAAKEAADAAVTAVDEAAMVAVTQWEKEAALKAVKKAQRVADAAEDALSEATTAATKAKAAVTAQKKEAARQGTLNKKLPKLTIKKPVAYKKAISVKWKKLSAKKRKKVQKIEVWVCPNKKFAAGTTKIKTVKKAKTGVYIKGLKAKKTYYVKVRTIKKKNGVKYVSKWSKIKKIKTK